MGDMIAVARVQLTIEFAAGSSWSDECTIQQVHEQATANAIGMLRRLADRSLPPAQRPVLDALQLIGEPRVETIIVKEPKT